MLQDLQALAQTEAGRKRLRVAFDRFGVTVTKWSALTQTDIEIVWAETRDDPPREDRVTPDDSPEGRALNARLDDLKF